MIMKYEFLLEYAVYLFSMIDACAEKSFLPKGIHARIWVVFVVLQIVKRIIATFSVNNGRVEIPRSLLVMLPVFATYGMVFLGEFTYFKNAAAAAIFVMATFFIGDYIGKNKCVLEFVFVSFVVMAAYVFVYINIHNYSISSLYKNVNLTTFFSLIYKRRFRFSFGLSNPNAIGNILAWTICLSHYVFVSVKKMFSGALKAIFYIIILVVDFISFIMLLITGSRAGLMCVIVYAVFYVLIYVENNSVMGRRDKLTLRIIVAMIVFALALSTSSNIIYYYMHSGRQKAFKNLRLINSPRRWMFGIGLPQKEIKNLLIDGVRGDSIDVYYIYILVMAGIVGLALMMISIIMIAKQVNLKRREELLSNLLWADFMTLVVYGLFESCVLNASFLTSGILWAMFIASFYDGAYKYNAYEVKNNET